LPKCLVVSSAAGVAVVVLVRLVGDAIALATGSASWGDWFPITVAVVGLVIAIAGIGSVTGAGLGYANPRRQPPANPLLGLCMVTCGLVILLVGLVVIPAPKARFAGLDAGATPTSIWAGYETDSAVTSVQASWTQPPIVAPASGRSDVALWVGLGGQINPRLAQLGTDAEGEAGRAVIYTAWYEMYPKPAYAIDPSVLSVHPGDLLSASVSEISHGQFRLVLANHTTHQRFVIAQTDLGIATSDAAVIAELPSAPFRQVLAAFGSVTFTGCSADGRSLGDYPLAMCEIYRQGQTQARTSRLGADGASFTVRRQ
jgi:hypothetical protein